MSSLCCVLSTVSVENSVDGPWTVGLMRFKGEMTVAFVERKSEVTKRTREGSEESKLHYATRRSLRTYRFTELLVSWNHKSRYTFARNAERSQFDCS